MRARAQSRRIDLGRCQLVHSQIGGLFFPFEALPLSLYITLMLDFLPLSIRYPSLALLALFVVLIAFSAFPCALLLRYKLRKRAASELRFLDEPPLHEAKANDDAIAVVRGRLVGVRDDKPIAHGTVVLDAKGTELVSSDCALKLNHPEGQIELVGPISILVGSQEGFPVGAGRRVLLAGDEVVVCGRWVVKQAGMSDYRGSNPPRLNQLQIGYVGAPKTFGLAKATLMRVPLWGAFLCAFALTAGASGALKGAHSITSERNKIRLACFAYVSPFLQSKARSFLLDRAWHMHGQGSELQAQMAAIESHLDENHDCFQVLTILRDDGLLEEEAQLGVQCAGIVSKRRAAEAWLHLGEFSKAAQVLRDAPLDAPPEWGILPLYLRVALATGDFLGAAKLLRTYGRAHFSPKALSCVADVLEARGGSVLAREQLASNVKEHWVCAVLQADLLDGEERLAMLRNLPKRFYPENARELFLALQFEAEPEGFKDPPEPEVQSQAKGQKEPIESARATDKRSIPAYEERAIFDGPRNPRHEGYDEWRNPPKRHYIPAVTISALERLDKRDDRAKYWFYAATWRIALGSFLAQVGDEAKSLPLLDEAIRLIPKEEENLPHVKRLRAALALRLDAPDAKESIHALELDSRLPSSAFLRSALEAHLGEGLAGAYYADHKESEKLADATSKGDGEAILEFVEPRRLIRHLIVAGTRIHSGREILVDTMRYYKPDCQPWDGEAILDFDYGMAVYDGPTCERVQYTLEYLAANAAARALALRHLRATEMGRGADLHALEERARKLREPLLRRDIAVPLFLLELSYHSILW